MTTMKTSDIKISVPEPRYPCEGTENITPDVCSNVHFLDATGGYHPAEELTYVEVQDQDTSWHGFFCPACIKAIEKADRNYSECGSETLSVNLIGISLAQVMADRSQPA